MPAESKLSNRATSEGGKEKDKKSCENKAPLLASASAHLLASLKQCLIIVLGIFFRLSLQSATITSFPFKLPPHFFKRSTTSFASNSIITVGRFNSMHIFKPSRSAQSPATTLVVVPIARAKPPTHSPLAFRIMPPPPTRPRFPKEDPFVFSLCQFCGGGSHLIKFPSSFSSSH